MYPPPTPPAQRNVKQLPAGKVAPGNHRKELDVETSTLRCFLPRGYASTPQSDRFRQGFRPCTSFFGGSNSPLSPPVQQLTKLRVRNKTVLMTPHKLSRRQLKNSVHRAQPNRPRGNRRRQRNVFQGDETGFYATREKPMFMRDAQEANRNGL